MDIYRQTFVEFFAFNCEKIEKLGFGVGMFEVQVGLLLSLAQIAASHKNAMLFAL